MPSMCSMRNFASRATPENPSGPPGVLPRQAKKVHARHRCDAAMMAGVAFSIENRQFEPTVVRVESDTPDDRRNPCGDIVELQSFHIRLPRRLVTRLARRANSVGIDMFVDGVLDAARD